ncbi:hypothetical protein Godav_028577, partial [Gossypium davidsonii]|nr:hypothetical protein [Gossypium davidsonii]
VEEDYEGRKVLEKKVVQLKFGVALRLRGGSNRYVMIVGGRTLVNNMNMDKGVQELRRFVMVEHIKDQHNYGGRMA